jgi:hypothetical protein
MMLAILDVKMLILSRHIHSHINPYGLFPLGFDKTTGHYSDVLEIDSHDQDRMPDGIYEKST